MTSNRTLAEMAVAYGILHRKTHTEIVDLLFEDGLIAPDQPAATEEV